MFIILLGIILSLSASKWKYSFVITFHFLWPISEYFCFRSRKFLEPAQICDIFKGVIIVVCCFLMTYIDTSMIYHQVRGQSTIKLYVFFNMLDVSTYYCINTSVTAIKQHVLTDDKIDILIREIMRC